MSKKSQVLINGENLSRLITKELKNDGLDISDLQTELVIREYHKLLREYIEEGSNIKLKGVGDLIPSFRRVRVTKDEVRYTSKLKVDINQELKKAMTKNLTESKNYRKNVGLDEEDFLDNS